MLRHGGRPPCPPLWARRWVVHRDRRSDASQALPLLLLEYKWKTCGPPPHADRGEGEEIETYLDQGQLRLVLTLRASTTTTNTLAWLLVWLSKTCLFHSFFLVSPQKNQVLDAVQIDGWNGPCSNHFSRNSLEDRCMGWSQFLAPKVRRLDQDECCSFLYFSRRAVELSLPSLLITIQRKLEVSAMS